MDPWTRKLPIGGAPRTLDSGQSFRGPPSKVLLIPACDQHTLVCRPGCSELIINAMPSCCCDGCCRCCCRRRCSVVVAVSPTVRPSCCGRLPQAAPDHDPRRKTYPASLFVGLIGHRCCFATPGHAASSVTCHVISWVWRGIARRRRCQLTVPPACTGLYGTVQDCTGLYRRYRT